MLQCTFLFIPKAQDSRYVNLFYVIDLFFLEVKQLIN